MNARRALLSVAVGVALGNASWLLAAEPAASEPAGQPVQEVTITGQFIEEGANNSMKLDIPVRDTPFSVDNYTGSFMKAIETTQVADLYRYMTGLQKAGGTGYDLTLRGFSTTDLDRNTVMTDGLPGLSVRFGSPPTAGTDHIEIVKGAASLLYGAVQPGGFVNIITKKPKAERATEIMLLGTVGSSSYSRVHGGDVAIDSTGPVDKAGTLLYRVIAQGSYDVKFRNFSFERDYYFAPSVTWKPNGSDSVTFEFDYRTADANYATYDLLAPRNQVPVTVGFLAPIETNYIAPGNFLKERGATGSLFYTHAFDNGTTFNFSVRDVDHHDSAKTWEIVTFDRADPTFQTLDVRALEKVNRRTYAFGDANLVFSFPILGVGNKLIAGASYGRETDDFRRIQFCIVNAPGRPAADPTCNIGKNQYTVNFLNPSFAALPPLDAFGPGAISPSGLNRDYIDAHAEGAYVSDLMTLTEQWKVLVGARYGNENQKQNVDLYENLPTREATFVKWLPQAGIIFQPTNEWSIYASYSTSFSPVDLSNVPLVGSTFKATEGKGQEIGAKANLLGGALNATTALFQIDQKNVLAAYPGNDLTLCPSGGCTIQVGGARSRGFEAEISATPVDHWTLAAGYAYTDARVTESTTGAPLVGHLLPNSPLNAAHLWSRYDMVAGPLEGFGVGVGLSYVSSRITNTGTTAAGEFILPGYGVMDLGIYKSIGQDIDLTLKVNNVFDKTYYASGKISNGMVNVQPGSPRTVQLTFRMRI